MKSKPFEGKKMERGLSMGSDWKWKGKSLAQLHVEDMEKNYEKQKKLNKRE